MKLNQVIAIEKGVKGRTQKEITDAYHKAQKPVLFNGFTKTYKANVDGDETFPAEKKLVEVKVPSLLRDIRRNMAELFDVTTAKDFANCNAVADITLDGTTIASTVPVTYLMFLEKQLIDMQTSFNTLPVLDATEEWTFDNNSELYKTEATKTVKTRKTQEALTLVAPTDKHPGQAQLITVDRNVGMWDTVKMSGAIAEPDKRALLTRVEALIKAVKLARESANLVDAPDKDISTNLLNFVFGS